MEVDKAATKDQFHALSNQKVSLSYYMMMMSIMMMIDDDGHDTRDYLNVYHISIYLLAVTSQFTSLGGYVRAPDGRRRVGE